MYRLKPFKTLDKTSKIQCFIGHGVEWIMALLSLGLLIYYIVIGDPNGRIMPTIGTVMVFLAPIVFELLFHKRFSLLVHVGFTIAMTFAVFCGCALNMHGTVGPFDEISHFLFGYISSMVFFYLLVSWKDYDRQRPILIAISIFLLSMSLASLWEIFEFVSDGILGGSSIGGFSQVALEDGKALGLSGPALYFYAMKHSTMLWDSITDMCLHLGGSFVFFIEYLIESHVKTPILLRRVKADYFKNRDRYYEKVDDDVEEVTLEETNI